MADGLVDSVRGKGSSSGPRSPRRSRRALERIDEALAEAARTARTAGIGAELHTRLTRALEED